jgi:hypothetical protein
LNRSERGERSGRAGTRMTGMRGISTDVVFKRSRISVTEGCMNRGERGERSGKAGTRMTPVRGWFAMISPAAAIFVSGRLDPSPEFLLINRQKNK